MRRVGVRPEHSAGKHVVAHHSLIVATLLLGDRAVARDGEPGPRGANRMIPESPGWLGVPIARQAGLVHSGVAMWTQELRVVIRKLICLDRGPARDSFGRLFERGQVAGLPAPLQDGNQVAGDAVDA